VKAADSGVERTMMTIDEIEKAILKMDPGLSRDDEAFKAQVVMLASADQETLSITRLSKFTGLPYSLVAKFGHNLRKAGIWQGRKIHANWTDEKEGGVAFIMDSMVAVGLLKRA
jgi:hypothetical protein